MVQMEWEGLDRIDAKLRLSSLLDPPLRKALNKIGETITTEAGENAPTWKRKRIKDSKFHAITSSGDVYDLAFGFEEEISLYMEYGTGLLAEGPGPRKGKAHYPPPSALDLWAKAHGWPNGWVLSQRIGERGGLEPRYFLRDATDNEGHRLDQRLEELGRDIGVVWES